MLYVDICRLRDAGWGTVLKRFIYIFIFGHAGPSLLHGAFSSCSEQGLLSSCSAWVSPGGGLAYCGAQALGMQASVVMAHRL